MHNEKPSANSGFSTPPQYFEEARTRAMLRMKQGGFTTPDGYFEQQRHALLQHIKPTPKVLTLRKWWYAAAAVLLIGSWVLVRNINNTSIPNQPATALTEEDLVNYVASSNLSDIPINALVEQTGFTNTLHDSDVVEAIDEETLLSEL